MRNFAGNGANGGDAMPDITAAERIDKIGNISALAIMEAGETTAKDIEAAAQAAVDIAADIMEEARQLATELRANGKKMSEHLKEFAALANSRHRPALPRRVSLLAVAQGPNSRPLYAGIVIGTSLDSVMEGHAC